LCIAPSTKTKLGGTYCANRRAATDSRATNGLLSEAGGTALSFADLELALRYAPRPCA